jgi:polyketide synthase PksN
MSQQEFLGSKEIADVLRAQATNDLDAPDHRAPVGALSEGQKGLWVLQKMAPENGALNVPLCFRTVRTLNIEAFKQACRFVLAQHPVLADAVAESHGVPYRTTCPQAAPLFVEEDISTLDENAVMDWLKAQAQRAFSLSTASLMRVHLMRRSPTETVVLIVFHHIAWDGNSIPPFLTKLLHSYQHLLQGKCLENESGRLSHADFIAWEREMLTGAEAPIHLAYWKEYLSGAPPVLEVPLDGPRAGASGFANEKVRRRVAGKPAEKIRTTARSLGITPAAFFLGLYQLLLSRYARSDDIVVGITVAIRPDPEFANVIGYCTNIIPIRTRTDRTQSWPDFISEVQSSAASSLDHAAYPFPLLVRELRVPRLQGRRPIF